MWVLHLGLIIHLRLFKSLMDYFKMNLHVSIAYKLWISLKCHPNYILVISKRPYMWVLQLRLGLHLRLPKSLKGYIKTNLNMGIAFKKHKKYIYLLPFGNISKWSSFILKKIYIYDIALFHICLSLKNFAQNAPWFILIIIDLLKDVN